MCDGRERESVGERERERAVILGGTLQSGTLALFGEGAGVDLFSSLSPRCLLAFSILFWKRDQRPHGLDPDRVAAAEWACRAQRRLRLSLSLYSLSTLPRLYSFLTSSTGNDNLLSGIARTSLCHLRGFASGGEVISLSVLNGSALSLSLYYVLFRMEEEQRKTPFRLKRSYRSNITISNIIEREKGRERERKRERESLLPLFLGYPIDI